MNKHRESITRRKLGLGLLTGLLALAFAPSLRAQTIDLGGTGALGSFTNPLSVVATDTKTCTYNLMQIDMALGTVKVQPFLETNGATFCNATLVDITSQFPSFPVGGFPDGVFEFTTFQLRQSVAGTRVDAVTLEFLPNANNTPVVIRATCPATEPPNCVSIASGTTLSVAGRNGTPASATGNVLPGVGGNGGPGGYNGGKGGNGGLAPSVGSSGFGPGAAPGGAVGGHALSPAKFLTVGVVIGGTDIAALSTQDNDLVTHLRGGSGGGGGGGTTGGAAGDGGGGGGGAILIAANKTIQISGTLTARGGNDGCCSAGKRGTGGTGGSIRLVAATITGGGVLNVDNGCSGCQVSSDDGILRLEAFTISYSGSITGTTHVATTAAPGQVILPTAPSAFIRFAKITDTTAGHTSGSNVVLDTTAVGPQGVTGRTGALSSVDAIMPTDPVGAITTVTVDFTVGPCPQFPAGKSITLVVTPVDAAQGSAVSYTSTPIDCNSDPDASVLNVTLPLGFSALSAFTVLDISTGGALSRLFPRMFEGEEIQNVRIQTDGKETEYVLIAKSGKEFPFRPR